MPKREIRLLGDPALREAARPLPAVDDEVRRLIDDMFETMYAAEGIGLAGPQVGEGVRVAVVDVPGEGGGRHALVNPRVAESSAERERAEEGCLSIPGLAGTVERPASVVVEALGRDGEEVRIEAGGLLARCLQHEVDHLDGILFLDRVSPLQRRMLLRKWKKRA